MIRSLMALLSTRRCLYCALFVAALASCQRSNGVKTEQLETTYVVRDTMAKETALKRRLDAKQFFGSGLWFYEYQDYVELAPSIDSMLHVFVASHHRLPHSSGPYLLSEIAPSLVRRFRSRSAIAYHDTTARITQDTVEVYARGIFHDGVRSVCIPLRDRWLYRVYWTAENNEDEYGMGDDLVLVEALVRYQ